MLMPKVRQLLLAGACFFIAGAVFAYVKDYDILCLTFQIFGCNCFGFWCGLMMISKAMALDNFVPLSQGIDKYFADPNNSDSEKALMAAYANDCLNAYLDKQKTANPIKDN